MSLVVDLKVQKLKQETEMKESELEEIKNAFKDPKGYEYEYD